MGILPQAPPAIAAPQPATDNSLVSVVPNLYWSTSARGALLIVGAEKYKLVEAPKPMDFFGGGLGGMFGAIPDLSALTGQKKAEITPLGAAPRGGWNPTEIATRFGAQLIRSGSVSAFAPMLLPDRSKDGNPFGDANFGELMQESMALTGGGSRLLPLLASLSPSQLQQVASSTGLPLSSLDPQQRALFQPLMRRTLPFRFAQKPNLPPVGPFDPAPVIPQSDQNQFHLRLSRGLSIAPKLPEFAGAGQGAQLSRRFGNLVEDANKGETHSLALKGGKQLNPLAIMAMLTGQSEKGLPSRKKPSALNSDSGSLNASVSLTGVTTVEALVSRIAEVTKISLFADRKIAKLSVSARGGSARAGDLIQALCWALGGAVRQISDDRESVYLLTSEMELKSPENPLAAMMGPISGMMQDQKIAERKAADARARLIRQKVLLQIPRGRGASMGGRFWQVAEAKPSGENNLLSVGELSPELQKQAEDHYKAFAGAIAAIPAGTPGIVKGEPQPLTQVHCGQELVAELVAPTLGAVAILTTSDANEIHPDLPTPMPPQAVTLPTTLKHRVAAVPVPPTADAANKLVVSAVARGLTELRVSVSVSDEAGLALLGAAAKGNIPVVAVLLPLEPLSPEAPRDRSWQGQTMSEWLRTPATQKLVSSLPPQLAPSMGRTLGQDYVTPEAADTTAFVARVKRLLALPGVTGFALERLAAPGYREGMGNGEQFFWQGGANRREQVAFVRDQSTDAAELGNFSFTDILGGGGARGAWLKRTTTRSDAFLTRLDTALTKAKLVPSGVLVSSTQPRWEKWSGKYPTSSAPTSTTRPALTIFSYSRILAEPAMFSDTNAFAGFDEPEQFTGALGKQVEKLRDPDAEPKWDGIVLDLSDQPFEAALALLERALQSR